MLCIATASQMSQPIQAQPSQSLHHSYSATCHDLRDSRICVMHQLRHRSRIPACQNFCSDSSEAGVATSTTHRVRTSSAAKPCCSMARLTALPSADRPGSLKAVVKTPPPHAPCQLRNEANTFRDALAT